jgi:hypothetical protein
VNECMQLSSVVVTPPLRLTVCTQCTRYTLRRGTALPDKDYYESDAADRVVGAVQIDSL